MNILISTTTGWNIGDDFIRFGCQYLLNQVYKNPTYIYYDRNPDLFVPDEWKMGSDHKSNRMMNPINWKMIDLVVLAGSPEFLHGPLNPIYEGLINNPHIPLIAMGVGYSDPELMPLSENEIVILNRPNSLIITRQEALKEQLLQYFPCKEIQTLPCPALFCIDYVAGHPGYKYEKSAVILQAPYGNQATRKEAALALLKIPGFKMAQYIKGLEWAYENGEKCFYTPEPKTFLLELMRHKNIHTSRLHGAIAGLSNCSNVALYDNETYRVTSAIEQFSSVMNCDDEDKIRQFKCKIEEQYLDLLQSFKG